MFYIIFELLIIIYYLGKLPSALAFAFISPEAFTGNYEKDSTNFKSYDLESFDLQVDSKSIVGYPITEVHESTIPFYYKFLKECNFYANSYSTGPMTYDAFRRFNFMIVENLRRKNITNGQLIVKLKFGRILSNKLYLVVMPVQKKMLTFDEYYIPEISDAEDSRSSDIQMDEGE